jgi:tRNA pseudouridine38-40 synthase
MRYLITFSYDGSKFKGYQKQPRLKTVQGEIEKALKKINGNKEVSISASGRTDALVHAYNQKAHFDLNKDIPLDKIKKSLNDLTCEYIYIKKIEQVSPDFHARFNVRAKEYIYKINMGEYNPIEKDYVYQYNKKLDLVEMQRAMKYLEGTHDFKSFAKADDEKTDFVRTIVQTNLIRNMKDVNKVTLSFLGTGFLRYQVRNMVGLLLEIGEGKRSSEDVIDILKACNRTASGITAPAEGLYLKDVYYK